MNEFIINRADRELGKFSRPNLIRMIRTGQIWPDDRISQDGGTSWQNVNQSSFASYCVAATPRASAVSQNPPKVSEANREAPIGGDPVREPSDAEPNGPTMSAGKSFARPVDKMRPWFKAQRTVVITVVVALALALAAGLTWLLRRHPAKLAEQPASVWAQQYQKSEDLCGQLKAAIRSIGSDSYRKIVADYAEKFNVEGRVLASIPLESTDLSLRTEVQEYADALGSVGESLKGIVEAKPDGGDPEHSNVVPIFIAGLLGTTADNPDTVAASFEASFRKDKSLSANERRACEHAAETFRLLQAAEDSLNKTRKKVATTK